MQRRELLGQIAGWGAAAGATAVVAAISLPAPAEHRTVLYVLGGMATLASVGTWVWLYVMGPKTSLPGASARRSGIDPRLGLPKIPRDIGSRPPVLRGDITAAWLMAQCEGKTSVQATGLMTPYLGSVMKVSGKVFEVSEVPPVGITATIIPGGVKRGKDIYLVFKEHDQRLKMLRPDDTMKALGRITRITSDEIQLTDCELLD